MRVRVCGDEVNRRYGGSPARTETEQQGLRVVKSSYCECDVVEARGRATKDTIDRHDSLAHLGA